MGKHRQKHCNSAKNVNNQRNSTKNLQSSKHEGLSSPTATQVVQKCEKSDNLHSPRNNSHQTQNNTQAQTNTQPNTQIDPPAILGLM